MNETSSAHFNRKHEDCPVLVGLLLYANLVFFKLDRVPFVNVDIHWCNHFNDNTNLSFHWENHTVGFEISWAYPKWKNKLVCFTLKFWKIRVNFSIISFIQDIPEIALFVIDLAGLPAGFTNLMLSERKSLRLQSKELIGPFCLRDVWRNWQFLMRLQAVRLSIFW